jgi:hypothetical protein
MRKAAIAIMIVRRQLARYIKTATEYVPQLEVELVYRNDFLWWRSYSFSHLQLSVCVK